MNQDSTLNPSNLNPNFFKQTLDGISETAKELLDPKDFKLLKQEMKSRMDEPNSNWTLNCSFKSIKKYDKEGKLTKVIYGEVNPNTNKCYGKAVVITKKGFKIVYMGNQVCSKLISQKELINLAHTVLNTMDKGYDRRGKLMEQDSFKGGFSGCVDSGNF